MAVSQEALPGLGRDVPRGIYKRKKISLESRKASWQSLARVELPLFLLLALFFAITFLVTPSLEIGFLGIDLPTLVLCPLLALTGIPCLMCGITRSFLAMGGLDISSSFIFHPLGPVLFLALVALFFISAISLITRRQLRVRLDSALRKSLIRAGTLIILAAWIVKVVIWYQVGLL